MRIEEKNLHNIVNRSVKMNQLYTSGDFSSSCSSDTDASSSEDEGTENILKKKRITEKSDSNGNLRKSTSQNIIFKLQNREVRRNNRQPQLLMQYH